jgi:hypothetical protein
VISMASGTAAIQSAIGGLCSTSKSMLAIGLMVFFVLSFISFLGGALLFFFKKENKTLKLAGTVLLVLGALLLVAALFDVLIYLFTPGLIASLLGGGTQVSC